MKVKLAKEFYICFSQQEAREILETINAWENGNAVVEIYPNTTMQRFISALDQGLDAIKMTQDKYNDI